MRWRCRLPMHFARQIGRFSSLLRRSMWQRKRCFPSWLCGATVVVWPEIGPPVFSDLLDFVETRRISVLNLPATYWHGWVAELANLRMPASLRLVIVGSEPMIPARLAEWQQQTNGRVALINAYGPSEADDHGHPLQAFSLDNLGNPGNFSKGQRSRSRKSTSRRRGP